MKSNSRGHIIKYVSGDWVGEDGPHITLNGGCTKCGEEPNERGHAACIKNLPGVKNACCGHGYPSYAYIQFKDGRCVYGEEAIKQQEKLKLQRDSEVEIK